MKRLPQLRLLPVLLTLGLAGTAHAADDSMFSLSGFGTLGLVRTTTDQAQYVVGGEPRGADRGGSADVDSKLGVQLGAKFNQMFSGTVQLLSKQNGKGNFNPGVEWAFAKAQLAPSLSVRLGRMGGPFFAVSDFRDVGFANTTLRPPSDVYNQVPVNHFDGADVTYQIGTGLGTVTAQLFGGRAKDTYQRTDIELTKVVGFNTTLEMDGGLSLRLGYVTGDLTVKSASLNTLVNTLRATPFASVGNQMDPNKRKVSFTGLGLNWDEGAWLVNAEYTMRRTETYVADTDAWYVTVGRRFGNWTPYATASQIRTVDSNVTNTVLPLNAQLAQLKAIVDSTVAGQHRAQKTLAVGTRWDFARNFALKAQFDHLRPQGVGFFTQVQPGYTGGPVNVLSLSLDTVF
ncbi:MAG: hypothetical protein E6Q67_06220 [Roseateles sp.]|nr:MAG: hypothetical protein E6Q67_06220 [Roseateles sp.]